MTTTPTSGAADLPEELRLSNEDAAMLEQAASMLEAHAVELKAAGADSASAELPDALEALQLKSCPCGATPTALQITGDEQAKWAHVSGNCCGEWEIEYRNNYTKLASTEAMTLAAAAWNEAPRASHGQAPAKAAPAAVAGPSISQVTEQMRAAGDHAWMTSDGVDSARVFWAMLAAAPTAQPAPNEDEGISREQWIEQAMRVYLIAGDTEQQAEECAKYLWGELDLDDLADPYDAAMSDVEGRGPAPQPAPTESVLIDGIAYQTPAPVAAELLRLHIDALQPAPQQEAQEPVAWANWKVGSTSYVPYRTREQAVASVNQSEIAATQEGPYEVVALYREPQPSPAAQVDRADAVNLARNTLTQYDRAITKKGVRVLAEAVLSMDAAINAARKQGVNHD